MRCRADGLEQTADTRGLGRFLCHGQTPLLLLSQCLSHTGPAPVLADPGTGTAAEFGPQDPPVSFPALVSHWPQVKEHHQESVPGSFGVEQDTEGRGQGSLAGTELQEVRDGGPIPRQRRLMPCTQHLLCQLRDSCDLPFTRQNTLQRQIQLECPQCPCTGPPYPEQRSCFRLLPAQTNNRTLFGICWCWQMFGGVPCRESSGRAAGDTAVWPSSRCC